MHTKRRTPAANPAEGTGDLANLKLRLLFELTKDEPLDIPPHLREFMRPREAEAKLRVARGLEEPERP